MIHRKEVNIVDGWTVVSTHFGPFDCYRALKRKVVKVENVHVMVNVSAVITLNPSIDREPLAVSFTIQVNDNAAHRSVRCREGGWDVDGYGLESKLAEVNDFLVNDAVNVALFKSNNPVKVTPDGVTMLAKFTKKITHDGLRTIVSAVGI